MQQEYANKQAVGFKNHLEHIAIVGAGGRSGTFMVEEMLKGGKQKITALTRVGSTNKMPQGVIVKEVDYDDQSSLVKALSGQEALVITLAVTTPPDQQAKLINAAATAKVPWILPNEFGGDGLNEEAGKDMLLGPRKKAVRDLIEQLGQSAWIGIACGAWYEFSLGGGPYRFGFDFKKRTVTFFDEGTTYVNTSTWPQTGRAVAHLLRLKLLPDDEHDKSTCLSHYRNNFVYVSSFTITQKEMFDSVLRVTGASADDWKVTYAPVKEVYQDGIAEMEKGQHTGFAKRMYARSFFPDDSGNYGETRGLDNDKLGLPKEDLDEFTKIGIHLAESGYFDSEGAS